MLRKLLIALIWLLALGLIYLALRDISFADVGAALDALSWWKLLIYAGMQFLALTILNWRWQLILKMLGYSVPMRDLFWYRLAGYAVSYFTPGPQFGGEPVQVLLLEKQNKLPRPAAIAGVALDKSIELAVSFVLILLGSLLLLQRQMLPTIEPERFIWLLVLPLIALILYGAALARGKLLITNFLTRIKLHKVSIAVSSSEAQIAGFLIQGWREQPRRLLLIWGISVLAYLVLVIEYGVLIRLLGHPILPVTMLMLYTTFRLSLFFPAPAGLGAVEAVHVFVFSAFGLGAPLAITVSLIIRIRDVTLGLLGLANAGKIARQDSKYSQEKI